MTRDEILQLRRRCCTDLYFLTKEVLGKDLHEKPHREMCSFFVKKDPSKPIIEASPIKRHMLLYPRGSFKSTISVADAVQWTIAYPNVRILVLTAEKSLSQAFAEEYRNYFVIQKDRPTLFQQLFPEFCVAANKRDPSAEFVTPARTEYKREPTLWSNSIGSTLPGWHCDVLILDDVVNDKNSENQEQIEKVIRAYNYVRKLVDPGGYINIIGTPWAPNDLYDFVQKKDPDLAVLKRPAWTLKPESRHKKKEELTEEDYDLLFPERITYEFLRKEEEYDPISFASQYMIDARNSARQMFTEELLRSHILPWQSIPERLNYYAAWDLAYGEGLLTNYTTGIVAGTDSEGRLYILDMVHGRFNGSAIVFHITDVMRRYPLQLTGIENMMGAKWLENDILEQCKKLGITPRIYWLDVERQKDAKVSRIARLLPMFEQNRLFISNACSDLETLIEGFLNYRGTKNDQDDIPDAVSFFPRFVPLQPAMTQEQYVRLWQEIQNQELYKMIYPVAAPDVEPEKGIEPVADVYF